MQGEKFIVITDRDMSELAKQLAPLLLSELKSGDADPYMTPAQLADEIPVLSAFAIAKQIREKKYGKKYGPKGRLMARVSEVKKFNRL